MTMDPQQPDQIPLQAQVDELQARFNAVYQHGLQALNMTPAVIPWNTKAVTAAYSANPVDRVVLADATGGAFTVTLPNASGKRGQQPITVKRMNAGGNAVTVASAGGTIDGASTTSIASQYTALSFISNGTDWLIV